MRLRRTDEELRRAGDVLVAIKQLRQLAKVLRVVDYGNSQGCQTIALTGCDGMVGNSQPGHC